MGTSCVHGAWVEFVMDSAAVARLTAYLEAIGAHPNHFGVPKGSSVTRLLEVELVLPGDRLRSREATSAWMLRFYEASTSANEVKDMVQKLFESFLDSEAGYLACEGYWETLVYEISESLAQTNEWRRWIPREYANGTVMGLEGNPMFDGRSDRLNRAFTIIQHRPTGDGLEIAAWLKSYEPEYTDLPGHELVLNLSLSEESAALARTLLRKWMSPDTTFDEMAEFVRGTVPRAEGPSAK